ncbi:MAG: hypothetical protein ACKVP7_25785 [Hyphomicrobiaceae bacterium]
MYDPLDHAVTSVTKPSGATKASTQDATNEYRSGGAVESIQEVALMDDGGILCSELVGFGMGRRYLSEIDSDNPFVHWNGA